MLSRVVGCRVAANEVKGGSGKGDCWENILKKKGKLIYTFTKSMVI